MELIGTVKKIGEIQTFASGFQKKELIIITHEQYPQPINIEFFSDKIFLLDNIQVDNDVKISINIRGREWISPQGETKYFNTITGWKLENISNNQPTQTSSPISSSVTSDTLPSSENPFGTEDDDDLPF